MFLALLIKRCKSRLPQPRKTGKLNQEMERKSIALLVYGFVLITFLYFIPSCQASRKLADFPPQNNPVGEEHDDPSKSGAHPSVSDHSGSATGDTPPSGLFKSPPNPTSYPTNYNRRSYSNQNNGNCQYTETYDAYGRKHVTVSGNGCNNYNGYENSGGYYSPPTQQYGGYPYYNPSGYP